MSRPQLCVLYIPGLGDSNVAGQRAAVRSWRLWHVQGNVLQMHWSDNETWGTKLEHLLAKIDELTTAYDDVAIVGVSAGAAAAVSAYALRKDQLVGCVLIAGKVNRAAAIGKRYRQKNPALFDAVQASEYALATLHSADRKRMLSRYAVFDGTVMRADSYIAEAHNQIVPSVGHAVTIAAQIIFGAPSFLAFLKALKKKT